MRLVTEYMPTILPQDSDEREGAVLLSGGLDSTVLLAHEARTRVVQPIYVSAGLAWEAAERDLLARLLTSSVFAGRVRPLAFLLCPMDDVYPASHWAIRGTPPGYDTRDEDVYLAGRNIVLLSKAAVLCAGAGLSRLALAPLAGNPFPDATETFFAAMGHALSTGLAHPLHIVAPFSRFHKADVIKLGQALGVPLDLTLSCMNPTSARHCGKCSKCRERHDAFLDAAMIDPTSYVVAPPKRRSDRG